MARRTTTAGVKWSKLVKEQAGKVCQFCGASDRLESHHIVPVSENPGLMYTPSNGVCLCHRHHLAAHGGVYNQYKASWNNRTLVTAEEIQTVTAFISSLQTTTAEE